MVSLTQLWLPIVLAGVFVFITSSLVHMVFRWHTGDYKALPNEDAVRTAIRLGGAVTPGHYVVPHCIDMKQMQTPEMQQKLMDGPVGHFFIGRSGPVSMGKHLGSWFALSLVIAVLAAYVAAAGLPAGSASINVFRVVFTTALLAYGAGSAIDGIWHARPWGGVAKDLLDATIYAVSTAAPFALLWPAGA